MVAPWARLINAEGGAGISLISPAGMTYGYAVRGFDQPAAPLEVVAEDAEWVSLRKGGQVVRVRATVVSHP